jgi:hypothetical protein
MLLVVLLAMTSPCVLGSDLANLSFESQSATPVEVFAGSRIQFTYRIRNSGTAPFRIARVESVPPGASVVVDPAEIAAGASGRIDIDMPTPDALGKHELAFRLHSPDTPTGILPFALPIFVSSAYSPELSALDFGVARRGHVKAKVLEVRSLEIASLELVRVIEKPDWVRVAALPRSGSDTQVLRLEVGIDDKAPLGEIRRRVRLETNVAAQPKLDFLIDGRLFDRIEATPAQLNIGAVHQGVEMVRTIEVRSTDGKPLSLSGVDDPDKVLKLSTSACGTDCVSVTARLDTSLLRPLRGHVVVTSASHGESVQIPYYGLVVKKGTRIRNLGVLGADADVRVDGKLEESKP